MNSTVQTGTMFLESQHQYTGSLGSIELASDADTCSVSTVDKEPRKQTNSKQSFYNALAMDKVTDSEVYYWGINKHVSKATQRKALKLKQLDGFRVQAVACGPTQIAVIDDKDDLYMLGKQLQTEWTTPAKVMSNVAQVSCGRDFTLIVTKTNALYGFGINTQQQLPGIKRS